MTPEIPFFCANDKCPLTYRFNQYANMPMIIKPAAYPSKPLKHLAMITGPFTASAGESLAASFSTMKLGPVIGTPTMGSDGRYQLRKTYVTRLNGKKLTIPVVFTPSLTVNAHCRWGQGNPDLPDIVLPRTITNEKYYDILTWITAIEAMNNWHTKPDLSVYCSSRGFDKTLSVLHLPVVRN